MGGHEAEWEADTGRAHTGGGWYREGARVASAARRRAYATDTTPPQAIVHTRTSEIEIWDLGDHESVLFQTRLRTQS